MSQYKVDIFGIGVFNSKYEDTQTGRVWQGVIKYMLGALIETSTIPSEHKLMVIPTVKLS